jgi:intracellular sulfur oxidation DsrE/DsrF family protein
MNPLTRRSFVTQAAAGIAAFGALGQAAASEPTQLVWNSSQWKIDEFRKLVEDRARIKQVYDVTQIGQGKFLNNVKNSLNGLRFGFDIPERQIKIAVALHGPANMINYDDAIWAKYQVGEWLEVTDPATGKPAVRNIYYLAKARPGQAGLTQDPDDPNSADQDTSVQTLQARGVQFLSCHTALEEQAKALIRRNKLTESPEAIVQDMLAHALPGVLVVASMVAAVALLQSEGHYTYITV